MIYRYVPHALSSVAIMSLSIHLVNHRRSSDSDRARVAAQISILESIADQLRSDKHISKDELERLKRLARPPNDEVVVLQSKETLGWKEVVFGRSTPIQERELSAWDQKDVQNLHEAIGKSS